MLKKSVSYLVLGSFLLMDAASCMEPEDKGPSSPPRSPSFLRNPSEPSVSPASSSSSLSDLDPQERLKAISSLPWHERNRLYAELALKEDTPMTLRREAFSSVHSTDLLDEPTREGLKSLRTIFLNAEDLPFKERFAFLRDSSAPPVATLLSLARALDLEEDVSYSEWEIYRLAELLMDYDHTETQQGIETCFFKKPKFFFNHRSWEGWLSTTLETSDESKRASMLQKLREVMQSTEIVTNIVYIAKFILKHSQNVEDKGTTLETFLNIAAQQTASHSETPREQFLRQKRDMSDACKALLPHVPEDKTALLRTLSEEMLQQVCTDISAIIDPQERLQTISILPYGGDLRDRFYAELALQEDIPTALRQKAFFSIYSTNSLDEATRKMLGNLIITFLSDDEPIDPHEILTMISMLPWNERNLPYAEFSLQEDIPMALRREAFSSIYLTDSLDEIARRRLENLKATFLSDEELSLQERLKFLPNADEEAPPIATLLSLTHALESANEESYNESNIRSLINFLMDCNSSESQLGIERCYFKQPELFLDGSVWEEWLRTTLETGDKSKRTSMLQKIHEVMHSIEDVTKIANLAKFILQHSQDAVDKETALGTFFNVATQSNTAHSEMPQEQSLRQKLDISDACKALLPHVPEDKATLLRTLSEEMLQQVCAEISAIIDPQERSQAISTLSWNEINRLYAEFALQENIPMALRREAFSSIYSIHSLDEVTRGRLRNLIVTFLKDEEFIDPQERSQVISTLSWEERNQVYAELALIEDIPMALRREALSSICSIDSLDEVTRERLSSLIIIFLSKEELAAPEESFQTISRLPCDERNRLYAELALKEDISTSLRREALSSIYSIDSLDEVTRERLRNLIIIFLSKEELIDPQESLQTISRLSWDERKRLYAELALKEDISMALRRKAISMLPQDQGNRLYAELALKEDIPMALRREAFSSIYLPELLDDVTIGRLGNLIMTFLTDGEFTSPQEVLQMISKLPWEEGNRLCVELALKEDTPIVLRREALLSIDSTYSLDEVTREKLKSLRTAFLNDERFPLMKRLAFLPASKKEAPPIATLLSLMHVLEKEISDSSDSDDSETSYSSSDLDDREYDPWTDPWTSYSLNSYYDEIYDNNGRSYKYRLYCFLAECPDPEIQQRLENYYFNHPIATALYLKEWLNDFYKRSDESQQTLILQKMRETMQAADMTRDVLVAAKFLLTHNQDHEPAIHALWKLVKEQASNDSEESEKEGEEEGEKDYEDYEKTNRLIMACKTLLKYAPTSPVRESVLSRLFTEAEQELFPRALVLLLTQEDPSISTRARELAEQRLDQNSLEYTLDLFFNLEEKNLEQDLRHKIQEKLKTKFNDSKDKAILLRLAPVFLRATDENLSQKAFNYLRQDLINNNYPAYVKTIVYQIIKAVGVDHPWAQEVINIGMEIGIEPSLSLREIKAPSVMTGEPSSSFSMAAPSSINLPSEDSVSGGS